MAPCTPSLEDFRHAGVDIPVNRNRLSVLKQYGGNVGDFCKETRYYLFGSTSVSFEFRMWVLIWEDHTADCCFVSGSYWYTQVASPVTMSQTRGGLPLSTFLSMWVHHLDPSLLLLFTQVMGHPMGTMFPYARVVVKDSSETSR